MDAVPIHICRTELLQLVLDKVRPCQDPHSPDTRGQQCWTHVQGLGMHGKYGIWEPLDLLVADAGAAAPAAVDTQHSQHRHWGSSALRKGHLTDFYISR